jgi:isopenicillin-N N-acyltransferase-like protein
MCEPIKRIRLSGTPEEIGFHHGELLAEQIHHNIDFYRHLLLSNFGLEDQVLQETRLIKECITEYNPEYIKEIDHIALGAKVLEPLWVYALNARTELALSRQDGECTALVFPQQSIIGQTWDWSQSLSDSFVIMQIDSPSGHKILQLTEAGIIGKIGLNNQGLGVTLNILWTRDLVLRGVPIHILLRAVLDSRSLEDTRVAVNRSMSGKASNIIVTQAGSAYDVEFLGDHTFTFDINQPAYVHTNHYIHPDDPALHIETESESSEIRHNKAISEFGGLEYFNIEEMISILSDRSNGEKSVLAEFKPDKQTEMGYCGTLATVVMDLDNGSMLVRKGNPSIPEFSVDSFSEYRIE